MTTIELTPEEQRKGIKALLLIPWTLIACLFIFLFFSGPLSRYVLGLIAFLLYIFFRNVFLLWREHWLKEVFGVDLHHLEKRLPDGSTQKAAWCDLQSVTSITMRRFLGLRSFLLGILLGPKPIQLFFSDGTVISVSRLLITLRADLFCKVFAGIAMEGPLGNPFLVELHTKGLCALAAEEKIEKHAYFRMCILSQILPLGLLVCAYVFYFWMGVPWQHFVMYNCLAGLFSPYLLAGVYFVCLIRGKPGLF